MSFIKKLFGGLNITWPKLIIWAVVAGLFTGLMAMLPAAANTSFENISIYFESWILFGIIIIMNSKTPKESAIKCFVFFLISQPIVYLIQVPFNSMGWGIFVYYKPWFIWTLFTLVMGSVGWFMKKQKIWGVLILAPILLLLAYQTYGFLAETIYWFPHNLLSYIFCIVTMLIYPVAIFTEKKPRRIALVLALVLAVGATALGFIRPNVYQTTPIVSDGTLGLHFDDSYTVEFSDPKIGDAAIQYEPGIDDYSIRTRFRHAGKTQLILTAPDGEQKVINITVRYHDYDLELAEP